MTELFWLFLGLAGVVMAIEGLAQLAFKWRLRRRKKP